MPPQQPRAPEHDRAAPARQGSHPTQQTHEIRTTTVRPTVAKKIQDPGRGLDLLIVASPRRNMSKPHSRQ
jgi:hypothetical protein